MYRFQQPSLPKKGRGEQGIIKLRANLVTGGDQMSRPAWLTPAQALRRMSGKGLPVDPIALAVWARDSKLRSRASAAFISDVPHAMFEMEPSASFWSDFWYAFCERPNPRWAAGELVTLVEIDHRIFEEWTVRGVEFNRIDLERCIRTALGEKEPVKHASRSAVQQWAKDFISQEGPACTERKIAEGAKSAFPGERGATTMARAYLRGRRAESEIR